jgi:hypothetical protein
VKNTDATDLYERLMTIQNAADLQWPATNPANAGICDQFRLNTLARKILSPRRGFWPASAQSASFAAVCRK